MDLELDFKKEIGTKKLDITYHFTNQISCIMGPSGAGKTTIFQCISGLTPLDSGTIKFNENNWTNKDKPENRNLGYLFQDLALFPNLNVFQNIAFGLSVRKVNSHQIEEEVQKLADYMQIDYLLERKVKDLSGGEKQRVAIARALIIKPQLLLFDEPFNGLDDENRDNCIALVKKVVSDNNIPLILITHHLEEAKKLTNEILLLKSGKLEHLH